MKLSLLNNLNQKKIYWKIRKWLREKPVFFVWQKFFKVSYLGDESKEAVGILRRSSGLILQGILYALVSIWAFEYLSDLFPAAQLLKFVGVALPQQLDTQTIDSFLTTVTSVSGVFLGLYFAAISAVAGNLLVSAPDRVRRLFLEEREGLQYIRTLVLTGVISAFYLVFKSSGYTVNLYSLVFLLILTAYNIVAFRRLGLQLFSLRSSEGVATITGEIAKTIKGAGTSWKNVDKPFIQNHFSTRATYYLETFKELIAFGVEKELFSLEQMRQLMRAAGGLAVFYPPRKRRIPTASLWFKSKRRHKKWVLADSMEITLALNSGTPLSPTEIRDIAWFERDLAEIFKTIHGYFLERKDIDSIVTGTEVYVQIFELGISNNLSVEESQIFLDQVRNYLDSVYTALFTKKELLMIADADGRVAIGFLLGFAKYLDAFTAASVDKYFSLEKIRSGEIYDGTIPQSILNNAEILHNNLRDEVKIEGEIYTTDWYVKNVLVFYFLTAARKYFDYLKSQHKTYFENRIDALLVKEEFLLAAQLLQRWLEFCSKYHMCISVVNKCFTALAIYNKQLDFNWPVFEIEKEQKDAEDFQKSAVDKMTRLLPQLGTDPSPEDLPDYFGQAFTFGVEACYQACNDNDVERFKRIFPSVFVASIVAFNTTRDDTKGWLEQSQIVFSSEPLVDLIEISGYAKLYAELYQNEALWDACKTVWDRYLAQEGSEQIVRIIVSAISYRNTLFMIMPKGILRTNWEITFRSKLVDLGLMTQDDMLAYRDRTVNHQSKLIRIIAGRGILPIHPVTVFFVTYLKDQPIARGIEFPEDRDRIEELLNEEDEPQEDDENIL